MENRPGFEIIVGTYEEFLLGYKLKHESLQIEQSFATRDHSGSLRSITTYGKYLASGGADDRIHVYDMSLQFTNNHTHLVSSSTDGVLTITRVGNWVMEKLWEKAHKNGYVVALAIHPTGKLALTLGSDCTLQTWNLIKGRKAYIINLNSKSTDAKSLNIIKWGPCGENFILGGGNNVEIWSITSGGILKAFNYKSKVTCAEWVEDKFIAIGHEDGKLTILSTEKELSEEYEAHASRVKCLQYKNKYLITASSSGQIKVWSFTKRKLIEMSQCNTGCRVTCIALMDELKTKKEENTEESTVKTVINNSKLLDNNKRRIIIERDSECEDNVDDPKEEHETNGKLLKKKKRKSHNEEIKETTSNENKKSMKKRKKKNKQKVN